MLLSLRCWMNSNNSRVGEWFGTVCICVAMFYVGILVLFLSFILCEAPFDPPPLSPGYLLSRSKNYIRIVSAQLPRLNPR